ncbi:MAG: type IV pilin [Methanocalculaceae archaeon]|jgi:FlaG/FlaF family flagellin (archaellin)|nr:type IV pilin [Methanocalculaceae archaeon]
MKHSDSAVSEVVGVLLLLTITLILVSVVAISMNSAVSTTEKPVSATIIASGISGKNITFENIAGDAFVLDQIEVRLGIREYPSQYTTLRGSSSLKSYTGSTTISLGDRFYIQSDEDSPLTWGSFNISSGSHLTYRFYDLRTSSPISSGEIAIP